MNSASDDLHYLYHLRAPEHSAGFGLDAYPGTTNDPKRRLAEHMGAAKRGRHPNQKVQEMFDAAGGRLQMHLVCSGTKEEILAKEALVLPRANMFANRQPGGGHLRGRSQSELIDLAGLSRRRPGEAAPARVTAPSVSHAGVALVAVAVVLVSGVAYFLYRQKKARERVRASASVPVIEAAPPESASPAPLRGRKRAGVAARVPASAGRRASDRRKGRPWVLAALAVCLPVIAAVVGGRLRR